MALSLLLRTSKGIALEALTVKFELLSRQVVGGRVTTKITVTDSGGTPYPVLARDLKTTFDGRAVVTAPHGLFNLAPLCCPPTTDLAQRLQCPPDMINSVVHAIDMKKLEEFFQTHRDAVWYYTTDPLPQSRRYFLDVEVNDGVASGTGTWSILPSTSQQPPVPFPQTLTSSTLLPPQDLSVAPTSRLSLVASAGFTDALPLLAQAQGWECQTIPLTTMCENGLVPGIIYHDGTVIWVPGKACAYFLTRSAPEGVTQFRWTGSGPSDPMYTYGTGFDVTNDGKASFFPSSFPDLVASPGFLVAGWFAATEGISAQEYVARLEQLYAARFVGWSFEGCIPTASELRLDLEVDPPLVAPSGLTLSLLATLEIPGPGPVEPATTATVTVTATHVPPGGVTVTVRVAANPTREELTSGGHAHGENPLTPGGAPARRPKGTFSLTGEANSFHESVELHFSRDDSQTVTYQAPEVGGRERIVATALNQSAQRSVDVTVGTLESLAATETNFWDLVGNNGDLDTSICPHEGQIQHPSSFWGTHGMIEALQEKMSAFTEESYGQGRTLKLQVNDMNLERGGLFDACNNWRRPHDLHRLGKSVDFNQVTKDFVAPHTERTLNTATLTTIMERGNVFERIYEARGELHFEYRGE